MSTRADRRRANVAASKQRRQMMIAIGGFVILAILLVIQGPRMLDLFRGSGGPAVAAPLPVTTVALTPKTNHAGRALLFKGGGSDPFAGRSLTDNDPRAGVVPIPVGAKDPFSGGGGALAARTAGAPASAPPPQPLSKRIVVGTPTPGAVAKRGWIVVLASIQTRAGRSYAEQYASRVRRDGLGTISVLDSSTRKPLRAGYYVVFTGPFATLGAVQRSADHVHALGYRTAYIREILRY